MRKLDMWVLTGLHRLSNWTYRKARINNYTIATMLLVLAVGASTFIAYQAIELANLDKDPKMARVRKGSAVMAGIFFAGLAILTLRFEKPISDFLSRKYDLDQTQIFFGRAVIFFRWFFVIMYPISFLIGNQWWGMLDTFIFGIALLFLSCEPPDMEVRMSKVFRE